MRKFAEMEEELKQKEQDHKDEIYRLERKQVIDKDMWVASRVCFYLIGNGSGGHFTNISIKLC